MDFRIFTEPQQGASYNDLLAVAQATEQLGFDAFFRSDHFLAMDGASGMPGPTPDWFRNLEANPRFTLHLKHGVQANLKATAHPVTDEAERRRIFTAIVDDLNQPANPGRIRQPTSLQDWLDGSVLVEIEFDD